MSKSIRELVQEAIENYVLDLDLEEIVEELVSDYMEAADIKYKIDRLFDLENMVEQELDKALEEMLE